MACIAASNGVEAESLLGLGLELGRHDRCHEALHLGGCLVSAARGPARGFQCRAHGGRCGVALQLQRLERRSQHRHYLGHVLQPQPALAAADDQDIQRRLHVGRVDVE
ncbi:hypothetical protein G6F32_016276 [Rhizopus arrhizus]|nr:hypothetical protein G6F32_016276 [Rhizopus arrhizus]